MDHDRDPRPVPYRRRFVIGLAVAALLCAGAAALLLAGARTAESRERAQRKAVITLSALSDLVARAGGGAAAPAAEATTPSSPPQESGGMGLGAEIAAVEQGQAKPAADSGDAVRHAIARVADLAGIQLTASTSPTDTGDKAAPRRLERDEKDLYDLGQTLRTAVEGNREGAEGAARRPEISSVRHVDGTLSLAAPVERGGEVVGMVQMDTALQQGTVAFGWLPFLAAWLAPVLGLLLLSLALGERRGLLAAAAVLVLLVDLWAYGHYSLEVLER